MKRIFITDLCLAPLFTITALSGIGLHIAGHGSSHGIWHNWAVVHIIAGLLFAVFAIIHIRDHWGWYKSLFRNGLGRKSHVTVFVSAIFVIVFLTGCGLLGVDGAGSGLGLWHYRSGLLAMVLFGGHFIKRLPVLKKSMPGNSRI